MPNRIFSLRCLAAAALVTIATGAAAEPLRLVPARITPGSGGGPWQVTGAAAGGALAMRAGPASRYRVVAQVPNGQVLHNHGCGPAGAAFWCRVETLDKAATGWVAGGALRAVPGPVAVDPETPGLKLLPGGVVETTFANGCTVRHNRRGTRVLESISCLRVQLPEADAAARAYLRGHLPARG